MGTTLEEFYARQGSVQQKCRHKPTLICKIGETEIYGASLMHISAESVKGFTLVVNLTGRRKFVQAGIIKSAPRKWAFLKKVVEPTVDEIVIDWKDYGVLAAGREFWEAFADGIAKEKKVLIHCDGGHGRTGTAVACLMTVALGIHGGEAIRRVREAYCREAIETKEQEQYVRSMTQKK